MGELSPGERGCSASHVRAWQACVQLAEASGQEEPLLVLEDDAAPTADFAGVFSQAMSALPSDAHMLYLGYSQAANWRREVSPEVVESEYVWTTVGYIIWPAGARLLLSKLPIDQPVDNWLAQLCADNDLKAYCVRPKIIRQSEAWNSGSDIRHSDEHYWGPDSDILHSESVAGVAPPTVDGGVPNRPAQGAILLDDGSSFWDVANASFEDRDGNPELGFAERRTAAF